MFDAEISIGSYKIKVKILLAFIFFLWIILGHTLCSCCYINLREGLSRASTGGGGGRSRGNMSGSTNARGREVKTCDEKLSKFLRKKRRIESNDNEKRLIKLQIKIKTDAGKKIDATVASMNIDGISDDVKKSVTFLQTAINIFKTAENSDTQKASDVTNAAMDLSNKIKNVNQNSSSKTFLKNANDAVKLANNAVKATADVIEATRIADTCREKKVEEGFTNSSYSNKNASTFILDPSTWGNRGTITASGSHDITPNSSDPINIFNNMKFAPECCPNAYTSSSGCACMDKTMYKYLQNRGGNNVPFSQY